MDTRKQITHTIKKLREQLDDLAFVSGTQNEAVMYYNASHYLELALRELTY